MPNGNAWDDVDDLSNLCLRAKKKLRLIVYQIEEPGVVIDLSEISRLAKEILQEMEENVYLEDIKL